MNHDILSQAPKVVLHDHLDGGLRPETIIELAEENGYPDLPTTKKILFPKPTAYGSIVVELVALSKVSPLSVDLIMIFELHVP